MLESPKTTRWRHEEMRTCNFLLTSGVKELLIGAVDWFLCNILQAPMSGAVFSWRTCESKKKKGENSAFRAGQHNAVNEERQGQTTQTYLYFFLFFMLVDTSKDLERKASVKAPGGSAWPFKCHSRWKDPIGLSFEHCHSSQVSQQDSQAVFFMTFWYKNRNNNKKFKPFSICSQCLLSSIHT